MTGAFVRIKRNGKWQPIEIDQLSEDELHTFLDLQDKEHVVKWVVFLVKWMQEHLMVGTEVEEEEDHE